MRHMQRLNRNPQSHMTIATQESYTHATDRVDSADAPWLHEAMSVNALYAATVKENLESHDDCDIESHSSEHPVNRTFLLSFSLHTRFGNCGLYSTAQSG